MPLTDEQRKQRASRAAYVRWAKHDSGPAMAEVRKGLERRWLDEVDPDRELPEAERNRRALCAMRAHMIRMAFESSKARAKRGAS